MMFDTWDAHGYTGQGVIKDNIIYRSTRYGLNLFYQSINSSAPRIYIYQNTLYGNMAGPAQGGDSGSNFGGDQCSGPADWPALGHPYL